MVISLAWPDLIPCRDISIFQSEVFILKVIMPLRVIVSGHTRLYDGLEQAFECRIIGPTDCMDVVDDLYLEFN